MSTTAHVIAPGMAGAQVWEMALIHRLVTRSLREVSRLVLDVPPGAVDRRVAVLDYLEFSLSGLHHHHETEDEMVWPLLLERASLEAELIGRMEQQHREVAAVEPAVRAAAEAWRDEPSRSTAEPLAAAVRVLLRLLTVHLEEEERRIVPLLAHHLTAEEWESFGKAAGEKFPRSAAPMMMGQLFEVATPEESAAFHVKLPAAVRLMWPLVLRRKYEATMSLVRGRAPRPMMRRIDRLVMPRMLAAYRSSGGRRMGSAKGLPVVVLTVPGRHTGVDRSSLVVTLPHGDGWLVSGSAGGAQREPQWFRNLRRSPEATLERGAESLCVAVRILEGAERDTVWNEAVLPQAPFFAHYERKARRYIPLAELTPR